MTKRREVILALNGQWHHVSGDKASWNLADWLRYEKLLTGTKIVCSEGDCGACTVIKAGFYEGAHHDQLKFRAINSCIAPVFLFDGCHIITVEGLAREGQLHPVQHAMLDNHASQCGYCTPGFVMAITSMLEQERLTDLTTQKIKNYLTGNLCRCTGYQSIINAALDLKNYKNMVSLKEVFTNKSLNEHLKKLSEDSLYIYDHQGKLSYASPTSEHEAIELMKQHPSVQLVGGFTDLGVIRNKRHQPFLTYLNLGRISAYKAITRNNQMIQVGSCVSIADFEEFVKDYEPKLAAFLHIFAAPQIKEQATVVGNIANASPIADLVPALMILDAQLVIHGVQGERRVSLRTFYRGYKEFDLNAGEYIAYVELPCLLPDHVRAYYKISQRRDLDISTVNAIYSADVQENKLNYFQVALGGVGPYVLFFEKPFHSLHGRSLDENLIGEIEQLITRLIKPISDVRSGDDYRYLVVRQSVRRFFKEELGV